MLDSFYIVGKNTPISGVWYKLVIKDTHFCVSSGSDLEKVLKVLKTYVKRYRTRERLLKVISKLDGSRLSPATFERSEKEFKSCGDYYKDLVTATVEEALKELREEDKANSPLHKTKKRLGKGGMTKSTTLPEKVVEQEKSTPTKLLAKRPVVFKHK